MLLTETSEDHSVAFQPEQHPRAYGPIVDRRLSEDTARKYGVVLGIDPKTGQPFSHIYPVRGRDDEPMGYMERVLPKQFRARLSGSLARAGLFGQHLFPPGSAKSITVTEGQLDAMAVYEMTGSRWPCVSLQAGASQAVKEFKNNYEYLNSFANIYVCFDADKPGREAALAVANLLPPGKVRIVKMDPELKDACGYKQAGKIEAFVRDWWNASVYTPAGILSGKQVLERLKDKEAKPSLPYPFKGLNDLTYGLRQGEAVIVTAPTGVGKSSVLREMMHSILLQDPEAKIGSLFLEETPGDTALGLMSLSINKPLHLPDTEYTDDEYAQAQEIVAQDRVFFYDSFGSNKIDEIISRVRYYAQGLGCNYIFLDHLSIIVSDQSNGDERKALDSIMTQLKTLTIELNIALVAVVHTNRQGQIRGTAGIEQLANIVINLERDTMNPIPEVRQLLKMFVSKNRFSGRTGPAGLCRYNMETGRLEEVDDQQYMPTDADMQNVFGKDEDDDHEDGDGGGWVRMSTGTDGDGASHGEADGGVPGPDIG